MNIEPVVEAWERWDEWATLASTRNYRPTALSGKEQAIALEDALHILSEQHGLSPNVLGERIAASRRAGLDVRASVMAAIS